MLFFVYLFILYLANVCVVLILYCVFNMSGPCWNVNDCECWNVLFYIICLFCIQAMVGQAHAIGKAIGPLVYPHHKRGMRTTLGIGTGPDLFFSRPNVKEKKSGLAMQD